MLLENTMVKRLKTKTKILSRDTTFFPHFGFEKTCKQTLIYLFEKKKKTHKKEG